MKKGLLVILLVCLIFGITGCNNAPKDYTVRGCVKDSAGNPVAGVTISFSGGFGSVVTGETGLWVATLSGTVIVTPVKAGWTFTPKQMEVGGAKQDVNFTAEQVVYDVAGKVQDKNGNPISGVTISFSAGFGSTVSDMNGNWSKSGLKGVVSISVTKADYTFSPQSIEVDQAKNNIVFIGSPNLYSVSGQVVDLEGTGIEGLEVSFSGGYSSVSTDAQGKWKKDGLYGKVTITPVGTGWEFDPLSREVSGATENVVFGAIPPTVTFADSNLELAIREILNIPNGDITCADTLRVKTLDLGFKKIVKLDGLEKFQNLEKLIAHSNDIINIAPLADLTKLVELDLGDNAIVDLSKLSNLTNLQDLTISANYSASDITPLTNLVNLRHLRMNLNAVSSLQPLVGMTHLKELHLICCGITDITPLAGLVELETLYISENPLTDISTLQNLVNLKTLILDKTKLASFLPLASLSKLEYLFMNQCDISNLSFMQNLLNLKMVMIPNNKITDLKPLVNNAGINNGDYLDISNNLLDAGDAADIQALKDRGVQVVK